VNTVTAVNSFAKGDVLANVVAGVDEKA